MGGRNESSGKNHSVVRDEDSSAGKREIKKKNICNTNVTQVGVLVSKN